MAGIPYNYQSGTTTVNITSATPWSSGSANVTGLTGFTQNPFILATCETTISQAVVVTANATGLTTMTLRVNVYATSATDRVIRWLAIQATPSNSAGS
jgi:hypothetical protein